MEFLLYKILIVLTLINAFIQKCSFTQDCADKDDPKCFPKQVDTLPFNNYQGVACPFLKGKDYCCNKPQDDVLSSNFQQLDNLFGSKGGGCDICSVNLKILWCLQTCDPNQSSFVSVSPAKEYIIDGKKIQLVPINFKINKSSNCALFKSCKKTKYASQVSAMSNAIGFTTFQGAQAYIRQPVYIQFEYVEEGGLNTNFDNCDYNLTGKDKYFDYPILGKSCECNSCEAKCKFEASDKYISVLNGISIINIVYIYTLVILITVLFYLFKDYKQRVKEESLRKKSNMSKKLSV